MASVNKKRRMSLPMIIVLVIAIAVAGFSIFKIVKYYGTSFVEESKFEDLRTPKEDDETNYERLLKCNEENKDTIGWVYIPNTNINYPVMQTKKDPQYYLRKNFEKEYSLSGSIFADARSNIKKSNNIIIYGHNMKSGLMFADLDKYKKKSFYEKNKYIQFDTLEGEGLYEVIGAGPTRIEINGSKNFEFYEYPMLTTREKFNDFMKGITNISDYGFIGDLEFGDKLITLTTCSYHVSDKTGRYVVVAKKVSNNHKVPKEEKTN